MKSSGKNVKRITDSEFTGVAQWEKTVSMNLGSLKILPYSASVIPGN